jgi:hypothetical protein
MKLCEAIAVLKGIKSRTYAKLTEIDKLCQKDAVYRGGVKRYEPIDSEDPDIPDGESVTPQRKSGEVLADIRAQVTELCNATADVEVGNRQAVADIVVDGKTIASEVPVTGLLFLEKTLTDLHTALARLPVLSREYRWSYNEHAGAYVSDEVVRVRTKKSPRVLMTTTKRTTGTDGSVTEEQTGQVISEDLPVGHWHMTHFSTAMPETTRKLHVDRVNALRDAVKRARERANGIVIERQDLGESVCAFIFDQVETG